MNSDRNLILIKGEDKTEELTECNYANGKWFVRFKNNKEYQYGYHNVEWHKAREALFAEDAVIYKEDMPLSGVMRAITFDDCYVKVIYKSGYKELYRKSEILIEKTALKSRRIFDCFEYLKQLAACTGIVGDEDDSFLSKQYDQISMVSPRSVLATYLEKKPLIKSQNQAKIIFPFGFNLSQKAATEKALVEKLSVIEGPPGTGKTQTILNIIANAVATNKTVAVVSNNNSAIANVYEKLQKFDLDFIVAFLGNRTNKHKFIAEQKIKYPQMSNWAMASNESSAINIQLVEKQKKLNEMLQAQNELALLKQELIEIQTEKEYFNQYNVETNEKTRKRKYLESLNSNKIMKLLIRYRLEVNNGRVTLLDIVKNMFVHRIFDFSFYKIEPEQVVAELQKGFYEKKETELLEDINKLNKSLENCNFGKMLESYSALSMKIFRGKLAEKYQADCVRPNYTLETLWRNFDNFIKEYPVVLSTTHSLKSCISPNYLFDYVIIDEASQVDIVTGALAFSCAKQAIIVGDTKQLPNVIPEEVGRRAKQIFEAYNFDLAYSYINNSLLTSIKSLYKDIPTTLLREHYRCHPMIIGFCNQKFYNNQLIILTEEKQLKNPLVLYETAKGNHARGNLNQRQIDVIFEEIFPQQCIDELKQTVGIITPFRMQTEGLRKVIGTREIEADTVHKYQGREKDVIILSTVSNDVEKNDFVDDPNLINVAVSRAVEKLVVVVANGSEEWRGTNIGDLVRYIKYNNFQIIESQIYSVFDLLYRNYSEKLLETMKHSRNVSKFQSENFMNAVIEDVLCREEFQCLGRVLHQPLKMLIKDPSKLDEVECRYAMNILTHTDFVIYNKLDKMPILVIEVDGYAFHANNPKQLENDRLKDGILYKYNIPILRFKTNESNEEKRLTKKLHELMGFMH